jgi:hypothetical protein
VDPSSWPRGILYQQNWALTSPTRGGRSVSIVHSLTQVTEFSLNWEIPSCSCHRVLISKPASQLRVAFLYTELMCDVSESPRSCPVQACYVNACIQLPKQRNSWTVVRESSHSLEQSLHTSFNTATDYGREGGASIPGRGNKFSLPATLRPALAPSQSPVHGYYELFVGGKAASAWSSDITPILCRCQQW